MDFEEYRVFEYVINKLDNFYVNWAYDEMKSNKGDGDA